MTSWWGGLGRGQRAITIVVAAVIAFNVVLSGLGSIITPPPGGPASSSFSTGSDGLEAYADLLKRQGHDVTRLRSEIDGIDLPVGATVVVADPQQLTPAEAAHLDDFVRGGGRLVLAGPTSTEAVAAITGTPMSAVSADPVEEIDVWLPVPVVGTATVLTGDEGSRWFDVGSLLPVAGADGQATVVVGAVGDGEVVAVADTGPLLNQHLAEADNAAFGLGLAGPERPVIFAESVHGYAATGLDAVPSSWKWAALGLAIALVAGLWAAGTRFGPPEPFERALRPPRRDHVDAVAADLEAVTRHPAEAVAPLADASRTALADRLRVAPDASSAVFQAAARDTGLDPAAIDAVFRDPVDLHDALLVGAEAARRQRTARGLATHPATDTVPTIDQPRGTEP